ncbi:hypothetical protein DZF92_02210 [Clavibacter michiganensis subsp. insidiosus]|uniref:Integral membrane protein n=1 Tax=Clavibacter michiganensis subsp. insidiosus TaxID=33014 RepID=A0A0D5CIB8_9MICO|nr:hypothetical protein VO01_09825 [Clavibacter michiganensis subsp. insidiosus]AWF97873.1 hypothetical protein BEH61_05065 [Clavibacter michiganensis subsp. insidiosus]AWG01928.1 hypothetical protein BEH62_10015 [Clavibacter michiganensis subsp. insidiosus]OQJ59574.1 hypothetical protein B5P21_06395 [Clavibacter michiganensis subsp. insidiosus]RII88676.1 hypothetical protein DZF92_02210 [Clavibacter michiganensis subsp. insidiosus]
MLSALLIGAGMAAAVTAGLGYLTRYSMFDALYGEIDTSLYLRITGMTSFEKAAILCGLAAALIGLVVAVARSVALRRRRARGAARGGDRRE